VWAAVGAVWLIVALLVFPLGVTARAPGFRPAVYGALQASPAPEVNATYSHDFTGSCNPLRISVHFFSNVSGGVAPYNYSWSWGDGSPLTFLQNPVHVFTGPGLYNPVLTVTDAHGYSNGTVLSLIVPAPPCAVTKSSEQPWVLIGVVVGFVVGACGLVLVSARRWRE
jgi:PKD repeat protein